MDVSCSGQTQTGIPDKTRRKGAWKEGSEDIRAPTFLLSAPDAAVTLQGAEPGVAGAHHPRDAAALVPLRGRAQGQVRGQRHR